MSVEKFKNRTYYWARDPVQGLFVVKYEDGVWWCVGVGQPISPKFNPAVELLCEIPLPLN